MILLFLSVWAIIIALNEVLFAAQPFSMQSIASALPHTLMFSVVLSAAVFVAKKKILDAIDKGQPIDKRFVADLTPEVGHELNAMRKQIARMDQAQVRNQNARAVAMARARARARARSSPDELGEIAATNRERLKQNRATYNHLYQSAQNRRRQEELKKQKERMKAYAKAHAKAQAQAARAEKKKEARARAALKSGKAALQNAPLGDPNDFVQKAHAQMLKAQERAQPQPKLKPQSKPNTPVTPVSAAQKRAQEEQARARRQAQIEALGAISSEDKAKLQSKQEQELKERKAKEAAAAKAKQAQAQQAQAQHEQLKKSLDPNAARAEVKAQTQKIKEQGLSAQKAAEKAAAEKAAAEKAAAEKAAADKKAAERKAAQQKAAEQKAAAEKAAQQKAVEQKAAAEKNAAEQKAVQAGAARTAARTAAETAAFLQEAKAATGATKNVAALEKLQAQAHDMTEAQGQAKGPAAGAGVGFMDQLIIPKTDNVDVSGLKGHQRPKRGAGLDISALKRVPGAPSTGPVPFNPPQLVKESGAGVSSVGGVRFLSSSTTRSAMSVGTSQGNATAGIPNARMAGAAFGTTLQNDATIERGKANTLDFASYQANARERALGRAQAPKATAQAQYVAAATNRSVTGLNMNTQTQKPVGGKLTAPGNRAAFNAQMQRPGLASAHLGDNGPLRQVVAGTKPVVGPSRDTLPKVLPSPSIESIQTAPKLRSKRVINAQKRDDMFKRELTFVDDTPSQAKMDELAAQTDKIHAQDHADAYSKVQSQTTKHQAAGAAEGNHFKRARARPSDKLRADEQV